MYRYICKSHSLLDNKFDEKKNTVTFGITLKCRKLYFITAQ